MFDDTEYKSMCNLFHLLLISFIINTNSQWISLSNVFLAKEDSNMAIGIYQNSTIIFLGAWKGSKDVMEFNINDHSKSISQDILPRGVNGFGQFYTQIEDNLFVIIPTGDNIYHYDLSTKQFELYQSIPTDTDDGGEYLRDLQIYDIVNNKWKTGPDMNNKRSSHSCSISLLNHKLYSIGGYSQAETKLDSIEYISIIDINTKQWQYTNTELSQALVQSRSVVHNEYVYVIGACNRYNNQYSIRVTRNINLWSNRIMPNYD